MPRPVLRSFGLLIGIILTCLAAIRSPGADDKDSPQAPVEVYEWSIWVSNPTQPSLNTNRAYRNAMPSSVGTSRPTTEDANQRPRFPIAPLSVVQFFGQPTRDVDVDLRLKKGTFLAHWPPATERPGRLEWFKADLSAAPPAELPPAYLAGNQWLHRLRDKEKALYLKHESHTERFVAYDAELAVPVPVKIRGGPSEYTLQNLTARRLRDVVVIAPAGSGYRIGWLDELPTAAPEPADEKVEKTAKSADAVKKGESSDKKSGREEPEKPGKAKSVEQLKKEEAKKTPSQKAEAIFADAEAAAREKKPDAEELPPLPAEGDANIKARVDQVLNRQIAVTVIQVPRRDALSLIATQARFRYELDDRGIAQADADMGQKVTIQSPAIATRDALAEVLGGAGLSYRVTEDGKLFITTAARLADDEKKGAVIEGPPVKLVMSQPRAASDPSYREMTRDAMVRRLTGQGLREDLVRFLLEQYGKEFFEPKELIVLVHLSRPAIDEAINLDVFPPPKTFVRTATVVVHGVDPRLQDRAKELVKQLGDRSSKARDAAEARLFEMGPAAVPALEDARSDKDVEIVYRAERLLLRLGRAVP